MFTGVVEGVGEIRALEHKGQSAKLQISTPLAAELNVGESISVDGCCLTIERQSDNLFSTCLSSETLQRTTFGEKQPGEKVNLERALAVGDRLGGHIVQGHIDTTGIIRRLEEGREWWTYSFAVELSFRQYLVEKGSIAVDGISLTLAGLSEAAFQVAIIPHTYDHTTLRYRRRGEEVNIEFDILGKYVRRMLQEQLKGDQNAKAVMDGLLSGGEPKKKRAS